MMDGRGHSGTGQMEASDVKDADVVGIRAIEKQKPAPWTVP